MTRCAPQKGKECLKCKRHGHFSVCCPLLKKRASGFKNGPRFKNSRVRAIESEGEELEDVEHVLNFDDGKASNVTCEVGGVDVKMIIDSGTNRNLIPMREWQLMKQKGVVTTKEIKGSDVTFKAYGQDNPIPVHGRFKAKLILNKVVSEPWFYIAERGSASLLGKDSGMHHGVLKIESGIHAVTDEHFPSIKGKDFEDEFEW